MSLNLNSCGSESGGSLSSNGYSKELYFDPEADKPIESSYHYIIRSVDLMGRIENLVDASEQLLRVYIYKHPLNWWQLTDYFLYHAFIVFETQYWWWSIEKNNENITVQRSKKLNYVLDHYRRQKRIRQIRLVMSARGQGSIRDLCALLNKQDHLNRPYHLLFNNCKDFAANVFNSSNSEGKLCTVGGFVGSDLP